MRVLLSGPFDWIVPGKRAMIAFKVGERIMTRAAGDKAIAIGVGKAVDTKHTKGNRPR